MKAGSTAAMPQTGRPQWHFKGKQLRTLRELKALSADDLGKLLDRSGPTILNWETGKSAPSVLELVDLANQLEVDPTSFFAQEEE